jgi:hypothetical protein
MDSTNSGGMDSMTSGSTDNAYVADCGTVTFRQRYSAGAKLRAADKLCETRDDVVLPLTAAADGVVTHKMHLCYSDDFANPAMDGVDVVISDLKEAPRTAVADVVVTSGDLLVTTQMQRWHLKTMVLGLTVNEDTDNKRTVEPFFNNLQYDGSNLAGWKAFYNLRLHQNANVFESTTADSLLEMLADIGGAAGLILAIMKIARVVVPYHSDDDDDDDDDEEDSDGSDDEEDDWNDDDASEDDSDEDVDAADDDDDDTVALATLLQERKRGARPIRRPARFRSDDDDDEDEQDDDDDEDDDEQEPDWNDDDAAEGDSDDEDVDVADDDAADDEEDQEVSISRAQVFG